MIWIKAFVVLLICVSCLKASTLIGRSNSQPVVSNSNRLDDDLESEDARGSSSFFPPDFDSDLFDHFPDLSYFPEFGEIFRLSRTSTQRPPYLLPGYLRDSFPDSGSASDSGSSIRGRPGRRPPRPAPSGTRTKVAKQHASPAKEKTRASKSPAKGRSFPKVFRFTPDRVNLADFDVKKKVNENYRMLSKGDDLDSDKVKRNEFLILHGGIFEVEPSGKSGLLSAASDLHGVMAPINASP